jgi:hypothetical protein
MCIKCNSGSIKIQDNEDVWKTPTSHHIVYSLAMRHTLAGFPYQPTNRIFHFLIRKGQ